MAGGSVEVRTWGCALALVAATAQGQYVGSGHPREMKQGVDVKPQFEVAKLRPILPAELDDPVVATRNLGFAYAELASSTGREEFHRKVVETLQPLVGTSVADAAFWQILGESHLARGEVAQAEEAFRQAVALDPGSASAHYGLGYLFQLRGKLPEGVGEPGGGLFRNRGK